MGLKWFRKRWKINKAPVTSSGIPGFYRKFSHFDFADSKSIPQTSTTSEFNNGHVYKPKAIPVPPPLVPTSSQTPAILSTIRAEDKNSHTSYKQLNQEPANYNRLESSSNYYSRSSIDMLRSEPRNSPKLMKTKNPEIKKNKKGRAPLPQPAFLNDGNNNYEEYMKLGGIKSFRESKVEI